MTTKYGLIHNSLYRADTPGATVRSFSRTTGADGKDGVYNQDIPYQCGQRVSGGHASSGIRQYGIMGASPDDFMFERIWIIPPTINARLITTDTNYTLAIWNAFQRENKPFTGISAFNSDGTAITNPTPYNLQPTAEISLTISLFKVGPAIQQTIYYLSIGGVLYQVPVRGLRVMALPAAFNFAEDPEITYKYETSVFTSERMKEQRRALRNAPIRTLRGQYLLQGKAGQLFLNRVQYGHDKLFGVPIINEAMVPTSITTGGKSIALSSNTGDMWNFCNLCSYIIILEPSTNQIEVQEVDSYTANSITTTNNIGYTYNVNDTRIYPCFFAVINNISINHETDTIDSADLEWIEKNLSV